MAFASRTSRPVPPSLPCVGSSVQKAPTVELSFTRLSGRKLTDNAAIACKNGLTSTPRPSSRPASVVYKTASVPKENAPSYARMTKAASARSLPAVASKASTTSKRSLDMPSVSVRRTAVPSPALSRRNTIHRNSSNSMPAHPPIRRGSVAQAPPVVRAPVIPRPALFKNATTHLTSSFPVKRDSVAQKDVKVKIVTKNVRARMEITTTVREGAEASASCTFKPISDSIAVKALGEVSRDLNVAPTTAPLSLVVSEAAADNRTSALPMQPKECWWRTQPPATDSDIPSRTVGGSPKPSVTFHQEKQVDSPALQVPCTAPESRPTPDEEFDEDLAALQRMFSHNACFNDLDDYDDDDDDDYDDEHDAHFSRFHDQEPLSPSKERSQCVAAKTIQPDALVDASPIVSTCDGFSCAVEFWQEEKLTDVATSVPEPVLSTQSSNTESERDDDLRVLGRLFATPFDDDDSNFDDDENNGHIHDALDAPTIHDALSPSFSWVNTVFAPWRADPIEILEIDNELDAGRILMGAFPSDSLRLAPRAKHVSRNCEVTMNDSIPLSSSQHTLDFVDDPLIQQGTQRINVHNKKANSDGDEDDDTDKDSSRHIPPLAASQKGKCKAEKVDARDLEELSSYEVIEPEEFAAVCNTSKAFELAEISLSYGMEAAEFLEGDSRGFMVIASVGYHSSQGFRFPITAPTLGSRLLSFFTKRNSGATATTRNVTHTPPQHQPIETIASQAAIDVPDSKRPAIIKQSTRTPPSTHSPRGFWSRLFKRSSRPSSVSDRS